MRFICCTALEATQAELHELKSKYDEESTAKWVTHFHSDGSQEETAWFSAETARIPLLYLLDCLLGVLSLCLTFAHTFTHICVSIQTQTNTHTPLIRTKTAYNPTADRFDYEGKHSVVKSHLHSRTSWYSIVLTSRPWWLYGFSRLNNGWHNPS